VIKIRIANISNADAVSTAYLASRKQFLAYAPLAHTEEEVRQWVRDELIPGGGVFVAEADGIILGMMALSKSGDIGWIDQLYLYPALVGQGIGTLLLEHAKAELGSPIRLYTFQENLAARRFYERHGFHPIVFTDGSGNEEHCPDVLYEWVS
jgi:GNAT superfamily N-acetyltransferase